MNTIVNTREMRSMTISLSTQSQPARDSSQRLHLEDHKRKLTGPAQEGWKEKERVPPGKKLADRALQVGR